MNRSSHYVLIATAKAVNGSHSARFTLFSSRAGQCSQTGVWSWVRSYASAIIDHWDQNISVIIGIKVNCKRWPGDHALSKLSSVLYIVNIHQASVCSSCFTSPTFTGNPPVRHFVRNCPTAPEHCQVWSDLENF